MRSTTVWSRTTCAHRLRTQKCSICRACISADDYAAIARGLSEIGRAHASGKWSVRLEHEDGQTALENLLVAEIGEAGKRVHLGRSRNDQVLTALRLYLKDAIGELEQAATAVATALDELGKREGDVQLPGYTHMQQAMPSSVALWAGGFAAELRDDAEGLRQCQRRLDKNPLGSAAGYGVTNVPLDRERTRAALGFANVQQPVTAVQLSRGKAEAQVLFEIALVMQDAGRLAADLLLFYTQEFSFVALPDAFTTGSSIMPQKRNPDVFELIRGRTATAQCCAERSPGNRREAAVRLSTRSATHQGAAVPRNRRVPRHARDPRRRAARREIPSRAHRARPGDPRSRGGERAGREGRSVFSRGVPTNCREAPKNR